MTNQLESTPYALETSTCMTEPNIPITIYEGQYTLIADTGKEICITGKVIYKWFPTKGVYFEGKSVLNEFYGPEDLRESETVVIQIDNLKFGTGIINNTIIKNDVSIRGQLIKEIVLGDKEKRVERIMFSIPNFSDFRGELIKWKNIEGGITLNSGRITFEDEKYKITLDKIKNFDNKLKSLNENGGYIILLNGEITSKKEKMSHTDSLDLFHQISVFLTFLNGKRTAPLFCRGILNNEIVWTDYNDRHVDLHKTYFSWFCDELFQRPTQKIWENFNKIWSKDSDFLKTVIHWYIESNKSSGFIEGAIIMAQTALELLHNYYTVEQRKVIMGHDAEKMAASNKIRLLVNQLGIEHSMAPKKFNELNKLISTSNKKIVDAPDAIVQIRNAIVHSQVEKRQKLTSIDFKAKYQSLQLSIWYIEIALFKILEYDGKYYDRCTREDRLLPWHNKP